MCANKQIIGIIVFPIFPFHLSRSQLGNAYFYLQEYAKAFEYHKLDLQIACQIKDKVGEAKASGNLGNTLKVLGKFEEVRTAKASLTVWLSIGVA